MKRSTLVFTNIWFVLRGTARTGTSWGALRLRLLRTRARDASGCVFRLSCTPPCEARHHVTKLRAIFASSETTLSPVCSHPNNLSHCLPETEEPVTEEETSTAVNPQEAVEAAAKDDDDDAVAVGELRAKGEGAPVRGPQTMVCSSMLLPGVRCTLANYCLHPLHCWDLSSYRSQEPLNSASTLLVLYFSLSDVLQAVGSEGVLTTVHMYAFFLFSCGVPVLFHQMAVAGRLCPMSCPPCCLSRAQLCAADLGGYCFHPVPAFNLQPLIYSVGSYCTKK